VIRSMAVSMHPCSFVSFNNVKRIIEHIPLVVCG
jgi:hypothetical protein